MIIKPTADNIIIKVVREEVATATKSGILLVQSNDPSKAKPDKGTVVALGKGRMLNDGRLIEAEVKVGDNIIFNRFSGTELESNGETFLIIKENDILVILEPDKE